jgi:hypothetical protein
MPSFDTVHLVPAIGGPFCGGSLPWNVSPYDGTVGAFPWLGKKYLYQFSMARFRWEFLACERECGGV